MRQYVVEVCEESVGTLTSLLLSFCFLFGTLTSLLEDELLVVLWTDILVFSLHVKLLLNCFTLCEDLSHSLFFVV